MAESMTVEVTYALPVQQVVVTLQTNTGSTVSQVVEASGLLERFPDIDLQVNRVGIFGKLCKLDRVVREGDRVEIYRPLIGDPKEIRRQLAAEGKTMAQR